MAALKLQETKLLLEKKGLTLKRVKEILAKECSFSFNDTYDTTGRWVLDAEKFDLELQSIAGDNWNHFEYPLTKKYSLRMDDGTVAITYTPFKKDMTEDEKRKETIAFLRFLLSLGMPKEKILMDFSRPQKFINDRIAELQKAATFAREVITSAFDNKTK